MEDQLMALLVALHKQGERQGPGGDTETKRALIMAGLPRTRSLKIADIGCGTGVSSMLLAEELDAHITAVDFLPEFLDELITRAKRRGLSDRIKTLNCSMEELPFPDEEFDVIWSEGAIYNIGFEKGISAWSRFLKPGGKLVVTEITWLTFHRPAELEHHWTSEYPEIGTASSKIAILERSGYRPLGYFFLPPECWLQNYYSPMKARFAKFLEDHDHSEAAQQVVAAEKEEIELYQQYSDYFSYGVYIAEKLERSVEVTVKPCEPKEL